MDHHPGYKKYRREDAWLHSALNDAMRYEAYPVPLRGPYIVAAIPPQIILFQMSFVINAKQVDIQPTGKVVVTTGIRLHCTVDRSPFDSHSTAIRPRLYDRRPVCVGCCTEA